MSVWLCTWNCITFTIVAQYHVAISYDPPVHPVRRVLLCDVQCRWFELIYCRVYLSFKVVLNEIEILDDLFIFAENGCPNSLT